MTPWPPTVQEWLAHDPDPGSAAELAACSADELRERFAHSLTFGTAGLRGALGADLLLGALAFHCITCARIGETCALERLVEAGVGVACSGAITVDDAALWDARCRVLA